MQNPGTLDAMSRRKLGSKPQHLSAIQGKPEEDPRCLGHAGSVGDDSHIFTDETYINTGHSCFFVLPVYAHALDARWHGCHRLMVLVR